jgi:trigger factor
VAGKSVAFSGSVAEVRAKTLPELTVELVKTFGDFDSVDAFKAQIRDNLSAQLAQDSKAKLQQDLLDAIVSELTVEIPEGMVRQELDSAIHDFTARIKQQLKMEFDQYLKIIGKTIEDIRTEWRADAIKRIKTELAIKAISEKESLTPSDTELDAEIQKLNLPKITTLSEFMASQYAPHLERLNTIIKRQKALDFILDNAKIS